MPESVLAMLLGIPAGTLVMLTPVFITRMILKHREKLHAMRYPQEGAPGVIQEIQALRREVTALRETTTKFDMAFDAAIDRLEDRVGSLEQGRQSRTYGDAVAGEEAEVAARRL